MSAPLPGAVIDAMAARATRLHHWMFHSVRNGWSFFTPAQRTKLEDLGWKPPRPAQGGNPANPSPAVDNDSGEDFLYMHRQMIADVDAILAQSNEAEYPRVEGWAQIPALADADYPVPPGWHSGIPGLDQALQRAKSPEAYAQLAQWERDFTDPVKLKQWTLGQLGSRLEYSIHNQMHMRWCSEPSSMRPGAGLFDTIDTQWDAPPYDWLGDTYSSHVNPMFWKLHGWIDDRIEDWKAAHNVAAIEWTGTWMGPATHGGHMHGMAPMSVPAAPAGGTALDKAVAVIGQGQFQHNLWSPVDLPPI